MYAIDVKKLIEKRNDVEIKVSDGPVSAIANIRPNDDDMELVLFGGAFVVVFDKVRITDPHGIELWLQGGCVASMDVTEWRE